LERFERAAHAFLWRWAFPGNFLIAFCINCSPPLLQILILSSSKTHIYNKTHICIIKTHKKTHKCVIKIQKWGIKIKKIKKCPFHVLLWARLLRRPQALVWTRASFSCLKYVIWYMILFYDVIFFHDVIYDIFYDVIFFYDVICVFNDIHLNHFINLPEPLFRTNYRFIINWKHFVKFYIFYEIIWHFCRRHLCSDIQCTAILARAPRAVSWN